MTNTELAIMDYLDDLKNELAFKVDNTEDAEESLCYSVQYLIVHKVSNRIKEIIENDK